MFFLQTLEREISIHPSFLGSGIHDFLRTRLYDDMEGSCNGKVQPGTGAAEFTIEYRAILWKPFKSETVDAEVESVKSQGIFTRAGPLSIFVSKVHLPGGYKFNPDATPTQFSGPDGATIEKGSTVRVQIFGMRNDVTEIHAIGKMSVGWFGLT